MNVRRPAQQLKVIEESAARSGLYRLLGRLWLREMDQDALRELGRPPLCDSFVNAGGVLPTNDDLEMIEQLAVDYCQLFVGPAGHLPPVQSVWQTRCELKEIYCELWGSQ